MDVVVWLGGELVRCLREDVSTDSLVEAWVTIYWDLLHVNLVALIGTMPTLRWFIYDRRFSEFPPLYMDYI